MLEVYQELIPFTNDKGEFPVSSDEDFSNPILMPASFDVSSSYNTVETVIYVRNSNKDKYYKNIHICLLAPYAYFDTESLFNFTPYNAEYDSAVNRVKFKDSGNFVKFELPVEYSSELSSANFAFSRSTINIAEIGISYMPFTTYSANSIVEMNSRIKDVRFSVGYDEIPESVWKNSKSQSIILPSIGNTFMQDNSYIPVRMRMWLNGSYSSMLTVRDCAIHIMYSEEGAVI
jgi:hypothetical protein